MNSEIDLYAVLEIDRNSSIEEIKKSYRRKALEHHPDKGGSAEIFKKISYSYQILSNPETKRKYDMHGHQGLSQLSQQSEFDPFSFFASMFSTEINTLEYDIHLSHTVSLEDLCRRNIKTISYERNVKCKNLNQQDLCKTCNGSKMVQKNMKIGFFGHTAKFLTACPTCHGLGYTHSCGDCKNGLMQEKCSYQCFLTPETDEKFTFFAKGEGNMDIYGKKGDLHVHIVLESHKLFKKNGHTLYYDLEISLKEALCGCKYEISHPSGEIIKIVCEDIISPDSTTIVKGKGMLQDHDLEVKYSINFPEKITHEHKKILEKILR